jgi:nucleotide-binding universal stress UspA family protein
VPFDGSELATAALVRATEFGTVFDEEVLAVSVLPKGNREYATERDWIEPGDPYDTDAIVAKLREQIQEIDPDVELRHELVDGRMPQRTVANRVRDVARSVDATMVFLGSENAGRLVTNLASIGSSIAADTAYDVVIVRHPETIENQSDRDQPESPPA